MNLKSVGAVLLALSVGAAWADIRVEQAYAPPTEAGQTAGPGYMVLKNTGKAADTLLSVRTDISASVKLQAAWMEGDEVRLREVGGFSVLPGKRFEFKPGGRVQLMFTELKAPLKAGDRFPATLTFLHAGDVEVTLTVK